MRRSFDSVAVLPLVLLTATLTLGVGCNDRETPQSLQPVAVEQPAAPPIDDQSFAELINAPSVTLVKFGATWCPPCHAMDANLQTVAAELAPLAQTRRIDTDQNPELAAQFNVSSIPHTFLFKDGKVLDDAVGAMSGPDIVAWVQKYQ